jgi:hypothetical protein
MIDLIHMHIIPAAYSLLPPELASQRASAMLLAIGLQESRFQYRKQVGGSARGFFQFEVVGVRGVMEHPATKDLAVDVLKALEYEPWMDPALVYMALEHNDILACALARLLLATSKLPLPDVDESASAWGLYLACWRPGKPHAEPWNGRYRDAWGRVSHPSGPTPLIA